MGALAGLKIADFSWVGAGPRATKDLADNGAEVIKIESRKRLDLGRRSPPFAGGDASDPDGSAFFAQTNTSKKSVTIDLSNPQGVELAKKLVAWADVVVENFGPGFMERIGLGFETLKSIKSDIILASVSVAGRTGPMAGFRGYGNSAAAHSGHAVTTGWPGSEPHMPPFAYGDVVAPMFLTVGILGALEHRARTGEGQHVDVSQIEPMVHVIADLFATDRGEEKTGNAHPQMAPHGVFPCSGDDEWIAIAVENETQWQALCDVLGRKELKQDARFGTMANRLAHGAELEEALSASTRERAGVELAEALCAAGVPAGEVLDGKGVLENPELTAAGHFLSLTHPKLGRAKMPAPPMHFSDTPASVSRAPLLGEHTLEVFSDMLGMARADVEELVQQGVLA